MPHKRLGAAAAILAAAALLFTGCGLGAGSQEGSVDLLVSRDYGNDILLEKEVGDLTEAETAMRVLDTNTEVETRYGGDFVQAVDGIEGGSENGRTFDWFFSVNGIVAERGSAQFPVSNGDQVWWDYRDWTDAMEVGAVVGAYPRPMRGGYDDDDWPTVIECAGARPACETVSERLSDEGVEPEIVDGMPETEDAVRILVGTWDEISSDPMASRLANGPARSGVFAEFDESGSLIALDLGADPAADLGPEAGLIAAMRRAEDPPVWLVTGATPAAVEKAADSLRTPNLKHRYAVATVDDRIAPLPLP